MRGMQLPNPAQVLNFPPTSAETGIYNTGDPILTATCPHPIAPPTPQHPTAQKILPKLQLPDPSTVRPSAFSHKANKSPPIRHQPSEPTNPPPQKARKSPRYTLNSLISLTGGHKCAPLSCVQYTPMESRNIHRDPFSQRTPRM